MRKSFVIISIFFSALIFADELLLKNLELRVSLLEAKLKLLEKNESKVKVVTVRQGAVMYSVSNLCSGFEPIKVITGIRPTGKSEWDFGMGGMNWVRGFRRSINEDVKEDMTLKESVTLDYVDEVVCPNDTSFIVVKVSKQNPVNVNGWYDSNRIEIGTYGVRRVDTTLD